MSTARLHALHTAATFVFLAAIAAGTSARHLAAQPGDAQRAQAAPDSPIAAPGAPMAAQADHAEGDGTAWCAGGEVPVQGVAVPDPWLAGLPGRPRAPFLPLAPDWYLGPNGNPTNATKWGCPPSPFTGGSNVSGPETPGGTVTYCFMSPGCCTDAAATGSSDTRWVDGEAVTAISGLNNAEGMSCNLTDEIRDAFDAWSAVAHINFEEVSDTGGNFGEDNAVCDIRIGAHTDQLADAAAAHAFFPPSMFAPASGSGNRAAGDLHFFTEETWECMPWSGNANNFPIFLLALHEIGHTIGLGHEDVAQAIMNASISFADTGLYADDETGIHEAYAPRPASPPQANLQITNAVSPSGTLCPNNVVVYTLTVTNNGPAAAECVNVQATLPTFLSLLGGTVSTNSGASACSNVTLTGLSQVVRSCSWTNPIPSGGSETVTLTVRIPPGTPAGSILALTANVRSGTIDPAIGNNVATASTPICSPSLVVNEVDYDQVGSPDTAEFVELKNVTASTINLDAYSVHLVDGFSGNPYAPSPIDLPNVNLPPDGYFVICGNAATVPSCDLVVSPAADLLQNGSPDVVAVALGAAVVDTVSYEGTAGGSYGEGTGTSAADSNTVAHVGLSRFPDGADTGENSTDFSLRCISPDLGNLAGTAGCTAPATNTPTPAAPSSTPTATATPPTPTATAIPPTATATATTQPGDCNNDSTVDAADVPSQILEIFDGDGQLPAAVPGGSFHGHPIGCNPNGDGVVDSGDLSCLVLVVFHGPGACAGP